MSAKYMLTLYFDGSPTDKQTISNFASTSTFYLLVLCSKYRYDDVSSQRFDDTSIDTAGPVTILWHVCSSVDRA